MSIVKKGASLALAAVLFCSSVQASVVDVTRIDTTTSSLTGRQLYSMDSKYMGMSSDGRYMTFVAENYYYDKEGDGEIVSHDMNSFYYPSNGGNDFSELNSSEYSDVFVYDRLEGKYELVSRVSNGRNNQTSVIQEQTISDNGRFIAMDNSGFVSFSDQSSNVILEDDNVLPQVDHSGPFPTNTANLDRGIVIFDREENKSRRLTTASGDLPNNDSVVNFGNGNSFAFSGDGRYLVYISYATNVTADVPSAAINMYLYDTQNDTYEFLNKTAGGTARSSNTNYPSISEDGRFIAFQSFTAPEDADPTLTSGQAFYYLLDRNDGSMTPVDVNDLGQGSDASGPYNPAVSNDGRYVAFISDATNLVSTATTPGRYNVYLRDMSIHGGALGTSTTLITTDGLGGDADDDAYKVQISGDGTKVLFTSYATNLVAGDTNGVEDVFMYDIASGITTRISVDTAGNEVNDTFTSPDIRISDDGSQIAVLTDMTLSPEDTSKALFSDSYDIYLFDGVNTGPQELVTKVYNEQARSQTQRPSLSADGTLLVFESATNAFSADNLELRSNIYLHNKSTGTTTLVSKGIGATVANAPSRHARISADGTKIVFASFADNLVVGDTNGLADIFLYDIATDSIQRVNMVGATQANGPSSYPSLSADGNHITYTSYASNLVAGDTNGEEDLFWYDVVNDVTERVNVDSVGTEATYAGNWWSARSRWAVMSDDGQKVFFQSAASNLVAGDSNGVTDIFMRDMQAGTTTRISEEPGGGELTLHSQHPSVSGDGNMVVYQEELRNGNRLLMKNLTTGVTSLLVPNTGHTAHTAYFQNPSISSNGEYVTFESFADNLVAGDTNNGWDTFLYHIPTDTISRISQQSNGTESERSTWNPEYNPAALSANGRTVAFTSDARDIVPGDAESFFDIFIATLEQATVSFSAATVDVDEDDGTITFLLSVSGGTLLTDRSVDVQITGGTATSGLDYTFLSPTTVTIPAGNYTLAQDVPVTIDILTDALVEPDETITLEVVSSDADIIIGGTATSTITIRDVPVPVVPPAPAVVSGGGGGGGGFGYVPTEEDPSESSSSGSTEGATESTTGSHSSSDPVAEGTPESEQTSVFTDTTGHWAEGSIARLADLCGITGFTNEEGTPLEIFKPDQPIRRAELMVMLTKCLGDVVETPTIAPFPDVPVDHWSAPWVTKAKSLGLVHGYGDGLYRPDRFASVAEATKIILLGRFPMQGIMEHPESVSQEVCSPFIDTAWYKPYMHFALNKGFLTQSASTAKLMPQACSPDNMITRAEAARTIEAVLALDIYDSVTPLTEVLNSAE